MDSYRFFITFYTAFGLLIIFDIYFNIQLSNYLFKKTNSKALKKIVRILSILMFIAFILCFGPGIQNFFNDDFIKILRMITSIWYLPKLVIVPVMLIARFTKYIFQKFSKKTVLQTDTGRRSFAIDLCWAAAVVPFYSVAKGAYLTTTDFKIFEVDVPLTHLPGNLHGLKIVQISDIHAGSFYSSKPMFEARLIVNSLKPDIIMITGDFVNHSPDELLLIIDELKQLRAEYGIYACLGNHDHYMTKEHQQDLIEQVNGTGIELLINQNKTLTIKGKNLQIAGTDNSSFGRYYADFPKTFKGLSSDLPTILMCHDPINWDKSIVGKIPAGLTLAGHTHGGQIGMDFWGSYITPARYLYKQWQGIYRNKNQYLYVNRGLGTIGPPIRVSQPPEITLITLITPSNLT
ncbi:MAG: Metallophos protein [Ignavibacteria bacterium]|nr:Metallophos protein [Ignavibacteria bacterium]